MEIFWVTVAVVGVIAILVAVANAKALEAARLAYQTALHDLEAAPGDSSRRIAALSAGRAYADLARKQAGQNGRAIFDEVALQNDLTVRIGK